MSEEGGGSKIKDRVTIHGLNKAAEFNGKEGRITGFDADSGRFIVKLDGVTKTIKVKPGNLESIPSGSGDVGGMPSMDGIDPDQMRKASQQLENATPEQLSRQAGMFKNMTTEQMKQLRRQQPQFKNMSDEQIRSMSQKMEEMARNPGMMKQMKEQMKNMTPEHLKMQQEMVKNMTPEQLQNIEKMQQSMSNPNVDASEIGADLMNNMSADQLSNMMKMQKEMLKTNPEMVKKMISSNPLMKNMSPEQLEQQLDMMADMDPKNLERLMKVTQGVQKYSAPLVKAYGTLNRVSGDRANAIILVLMAMFFWYLIDYLFLAGGRTANQAFVDPIASDRIDPLDVLDDDEL